MRTLLFTVLCIFSSYISSGCEVFLSGPDALCGGTPTTATYVVDASGVDAPCTYTIRFSVSTLGGVIQNVVDGNGFPQFVDPNASSWSRNNSPALPLTFTVRWNTPGCHEVSTLLLGNGAPCANCTETKSMSTTVGTEDLINDVIIVGSDEAEACTTVKFQATGRNSGCATSYRWEIEGEVFTTEENCLEYYVESCPLGPVSVRANGPCGNTNIIKNFDCVNKTVPNLQYPSFICIGNKWSLTIPGTDVSFFVITDGGNNLNINTNTNTISFIAWNPGTVIFTVKFSYCGLTYTRTIFVQVRECNGYYLGKDDSHDSSSTKEELMQRETNQLNPDEVAIYPNPVQELVTISVKSKDFAAMIFNMDGKLLQEHTNLSQVAELDLSALSAGTYFVVIRDAQSVSTHRLVKI